MSGVGDAIRLWFQAHLRIGIFWNNLNGDDASMILPKRNAPQSFYSTASRSVLPCPDHRRQVLRVKRQN